MNESQERDLLKGEAVGRVLAEPFFLEAVEDVRQQIIREWGESLNVNQRETAHATLKGLEKLMEKLKGIKSSGEHVRIALAKSAQPRKTSP